MTSLREIKEVKLFMGAERLKALCVKHKFYTRGNCEEYERLLYKCNGRVTKSKIYDIAKDIMEHSTLDDKYCWDVTDIMNMIYKSCVMTYFDFE